MSSKIIIFAGPSLNHVQYNTGLGLTFLPPCKQGDVFLATLEKPDVIGIIDGYFEGSPSVWHKEVLWALSQGIHVIGAASMGALRAAELNRFGMVGIGQIYEWYRDRIIEDDDEVALLHGPEEMDYISLSVAMVNIRANCRKALSREVISKETSQLINKTAKGIFYKERNWTRIFDQAKALECDAKAIGIFENWLENGKIDQKNIDANMLCEFVMQTDFTHPFEPDFTFEETEFWHRNTKLWTKLAAQPDKRDGSDGYRLFS